VRDGATVVSVDVGHPHHHAVASEPVAQRCGAAVGDDQRAPARDAELRTVRTDAQPLSEAERAAQPGDGLPDVGVRKLGDYHCSGYRPI